MLNEDEPNEYTCKTETAKGYQELLVFQTHNSESFLH